MIRSRTPYYKSWVHFVLRKYKMSIKTIFKYIFYSYLLLFFKVIACTNNGSNELVMSSTFGASETSHETIILVIYYIFICDCILIFVSVQNLRNTAHKENASKSKCVLGRSS